MAARNESSLDQDGKGYRGPGLCLVLDGDLIFGF
jgi:hypothetical protein